MTNNNRTHIEDSYPIRITFGVPIGITMNPYVYADVSFGFLPFPLLIKRRSQKAVGMFQEDGR